MYRKSQRKATNRAKQTKQARAGSSRAERPDPSMEEVNKKKRVRSWDSITHPEALRIGGRPLPHRSPRAAAACLPEPAPRDTPGDGGQRPSPTLQKNASVRTSEAEAAAEDGDPAANPRSRRWTATGAKPLLLGWRRRGERREKGVGRAALFILRGTGAFPRGRSTLRPTPGR